MKIKTFIIAAFMLVAGLQSVVAQDANVQPKRTPLTPEQRIERQANQMKDILLLDDVTADRFTKLYVKYQNELRGCEKKDDVKVKTSEMTDAQIDASIQARFDRSRKILDIREKYYKEFKKILTPRQIQKVYNQENINKNKVKKELEQRKAKKNTSNKKNKK